MNYTNKELRNLSKTDMAGNWGTAVLLIILVSILMSLISQLIVSLGVSGPSLPPNFTDPVALEAYYASALPNLARSISLSSIITSLLAAIFQLGINFGYLDLVDGKKLKVEHLVAGFKNNVGRNLVVVIIKEIIVGIGLMLLIIPGIVISFMLMPVPYLLKDKPDLDIGSTLSKAKDLMKGHKMNLLSLFLPYILLPLVLSLAFIVVIAYFASREMIGSILAATLIFGLAMIPLAFWLQIKVSALEASYYRRNLQPKLVESKGEETFTTYEEVDPYANFDTNSQDFNQTDEIDELNDENNKYM